MYVTKFIYFHALLDEWRLSPFLAVSISPHLISMNSSPNTSRSGALDSVWRLYLRCVTRFIELWALSDVWYHYCFFTPPHIPPSISMSSAPNTSSQAALANVLKAYLRYVLHFIDLWAPPDVQHRCSVLQPPHVPPFELDEFCTKHVESGCIGERMEGAFEVCDTSYRFMGSV
jgi:hypothetical protein